MSYVAAAGEFNRDTNYISSRITADGRDGYPVEPGRYRLIVARACPWANRTIIVRRLLGLEKVLSIGFCGPTHDTRSWTFDLDPGGLDPVLKIHFLRDAYNKRIPDYPKGVTVPAIVDAPTGAVVTNDFAQMTVDFSTQWTHFHREGAPQLYPERRRDEIDDVAQRIYTEVNDGVYQCGFASSQDAYDRAYDRLFSALDWLSERLQTQRYLVGDMLGQLRIADHHDAAVDGQVEGEDVAVPTGQPLDHRPPRHRKAQSLQQLREPGRGGQADFGGCRWGGG